MFRLVIYIYIYIYYTYYDFTKIWKQIQFIKCFTCCFNARTFILNWINCLNITWLTAACLAVRRAATWNDGSSSCNVWDKEAEENENDPKVQVAWFENEAPLWCHHHVYTLLYQGWDWHFGRLFFWLHLQDITVGAQATGWLSSWALAAYSLEFTSTINLPKSQLEK